MAIDIVFVPHVSDATLLAIIAAAIALVGAGALLRAPGIIWRALAMAGAILVLANPSMIEEERRGLPDVAVIIADNIVVLEEGKKISEGPPSVVGKDQVVVDAYLGVVHA